MSLYYIIDKLKSRLPGAKAKRLALAERETLKAIAILAAQHEQVEKTLNEVIEALNSFSAIVGLEWKQSDKRWMRIQ